MRSMNVHRAAAAVTFSLIAAVGAGCETKSFLDPSEMGRYDKTPLVVPILDKLVVGVEGDDAQFVTARDVTDEDLKVARTDYTVGANDLLSVTIQDLAGAGLQQVEQKRVSESGNISLPYLGQVNVAGQTEAEIEATIIKAYADAQILPKAVIGVAVVESQNRIYTVSGSVTRGGTFTLMRGDMRVLEAINFAGGATSELGIESIYVIRQKRTPRSTDGTTPATPGAEPTTPAGNDPLAPQGRATPTQMPAGLTSPIFARAIAEQPAPQTPEEAREAARRLANEIRTDTGATQTPAPVAPGADGRVIQIEGAGTQPVTPDATPVITTLPPEGLTPADPTMAAGTTDAPFEFTAPAEPTDQEVIRVPYSALKRGELKYNVVIHPGDMIYVPSPPIGEYYVGGHVARPGVYSLSAREITLKQAIISAGMLDQLAIPARTDVIRRLGRGKEVFVRVDLERIFAGLEPDVYLKPDDQVMVGTNIGATFLASFRNAFRITYGFGFLYDRNYAPVRNQQ